MNAKKSIYESLKFIDASDKITANNIISTVPRGTIDIYCIRKIPKLLGAKIIFVFFPKLFITNCKT